MHGKVANVRENMATADICSDARESMATANICSDAREIMLCYAYRKSTQKLYHQILPE